MKAVQDMTASELLEEQAKREANRRAGRPLDWVKPAILAAQDAERQLEQLRDDRKAEKEEQRAIRKMAIAVGFKVYWLSQAEHSGQTPGLGDLWIVHVGRSLAGWWETKRQVGGKRSNVQEDFASECQSCFIPYGSGDRYEFAKWLTQYGVTPPPFPE